MLSENDNRPVLDVIVYGVLTGIGLAIGAAIVGLLLRMMGVRWNPA
jgi:ABC-type arginine transport system permease subunit